MIQLLSLKLFHDNSIACRQLDGARIQADILNTKVLISTWQVHDTIDDYYNNKLLDKATIQIER